MGFGNSEQNFGTIASKFTVAMWYTDLSVSPQSRSLFSASFQTFCLSARAYLNTQKYGLFCSLVKDKRT